MALRLGVKRAKSESGGDGVAYRPIFTVRVPSGLLMASPDCVLLARIAFLLGAAYADIEIIKFQ